MSETQIISYLSMALDQEACKNTLVSALTSRIIALGKENITTPQIINCLDSMCEDIYQINDDVIEYVMELLLVGVIKMPHKNN